MDLMRIARSVTEREAAWLRLQSDPLWHKMKFSLRNQLVDESLEWAKRAVERYETLHAQDTMSSLATAYRLHLVQEEAVDDEVLRFSLKVDHLRRRIRFNSRSARQIADWLRQQDLLTNEEAVLHMQFLQAFYAFFAREEELLASDHIPEAPVKRWGLFPATVPVRWADMAAGDYFAQTICGFPIPLIFIPYLYLVDTKKASETALLSVLDTMREEMNEDGNRH